MAKIIDAHWHAPKFDLDDIDKSRCEEQAYLELIQEKARSLHPGDELAGEILDFPYADGYAKYIVWRSRPLTLVWVRLGDAWRIQPFAERGLRIDDVRQLVARRKAVASIIKKKAARQT